MVFPVAHKSGFLGEGSSTNVADIRFFACVNENVLFLGSLSSEVFAADRTGKRFDAGVNSRVSLEIAGSEFLTARWT